jgi:hypothetical protein
LSSLVSARGGLLTLQQLREQLADTPLSLGSGVEAGLQSSAHRTGLTDQPAWLTMGVWLDLLDAVDPGPLLVQLLAGLGQSEFPVWGHLRFVAQNRAHGWEAYLRRPGATSAVHLGRAVDSAEVGELVAQVTAAWREGRETVSSGEAVPASATQPQPAGEWEGVGTDPDGSAHFGYFRSGARVPPEHLFDLIDLAWQSKLTRAWLIPGPTLLFRGLPAAALPAWRAWADGHGLPQRRSPWESAVRVWGDPEALRPAQRRLSALLEASDRLPRGGAVVLAHAAASRSQGAFCPGWPLVVPEGDHWLWRGADLATSGEGGRRRTRSVPPDPRPGRLGA